MTGKRSLLSVAKRKYFTAYLYAKQNTHIKLTQDSAPLDQKSKRSLRMSNSCRRVKVGKAFFPADPIIGCPYGTLFTLSADGKSLEKTHQ